MKRGVHIDFDGAWDAGRVGVPTVDLQFQGPSLRYMAPEGEIANTFIGLHERIREERFFLYGSGDFHYLAAWFLRNVVEASGAEGVRVVSFDNHPDWDIRPPRWACGGWINRALEMKGVAGAAVWGCGNFELAFPGRLFRNRRALRNGRLEVHGWAERQEESVAKKFKCMTRADWRERFEEFGERLRGRKIYVTVDMDGLAAEYAVTNWENGLFTPEDVAWAIGVLRKNGEVIGGDCCGAYSKPRYARRFQRFAGKWDHPRMATPEMEKAREVNHRSLGILWPALAGE